MLDFTSALYLGFEHPSWSLAGWPSLTLGKPAALEEFPDAAEAQRELAALTGCRQAQLGTSTLHLFCDLFTMLAGPDVAIWIDEAAYPIAGWGADRAVASGTPVRKFPRHDAAALWRSITGAPRARPVIVTDGYCPLWGAHAPIREYAACADRGGGLLVVDDTQALGIFGRRVDPKEPYGSGGGGSLRYANLNDSRVLVVSSLAKAFGAPIAMLGGSRALVDWYRERSGTLAHCSPPSAAAVSAALRASRLNRQCGDALRRGLADRVSRFRQGAGQFAASAGWFPVQSIRLPGRLDARAVYEVLLARGVRTLLLRDPVAEGGQIEFVVTVRHGLNEIDYAVESLRGAVTAVQRVRKGSNHVASNGGRDGALGSAWRSDRPVAEPSRSLRGF